MPICFNCGHLAPEGSKICQGCGKPLAGGAEQTPSPAKAPAPPDSGATSAAAKRTPKPADAAKTSKPSGKDARPEDAPKNKSSKTGAKDQKSKSSGKQKNQKDKGKGKLSKTAAKEKKSFFSRKEKASSPIVPLEIEEPELPDEMKNVPGARIIEPPDENELPVLKSPKIYFIAASLLLLPALTLPWFKLYPSVPIEAFKLPLALLFSSRMSAPFLSVGALICPLFAAALGLSLYSRRLDIVMKALGIFLAAVSLSVLLLGLRQWQAKEGLDPSAFAGYISARQNKLPAVSVFGPEIKIPEGGPAGAPAGSDAKGIIEFFIKVIGPGAMFPLLSGILFFAVCMKFSTVLRSVEIKTSHVVIALISVPILFMFIFFMLVRLCPVWVMKEVSHVYTVMDNPTAATALLEKCAKFPAPNDVCKIELARTYLNAGNKTAAKNILQSKFKNEKKYPELHQTLGDLSFAEKDYGDAAEQFKKYVKTVPADVKYKEKLTKTLLILADEQYGAESWEAANNLYIEALGVMKANENNDNIQYKIGDCYERLGNLKDSLPYYTKAALLRPNEVELQVVVAKKYEMNGDFDNAIKFYQKSIDIRKELAESYLAIGDIYMNALNKQDEAVDWYKKTIEANEPSDAAATAKKKLKAIQGGE